MDGQSPIIAGLLFVAVVFVLLRTVLRKKSSRATGRRSEARENAEEAELGAAARAEMLEVRLFDFAREVEARMQTQIAVLDRLIVEADSEIVRLKEVLAAANGALSALAGPSRMLEGASAAPVNLSGAAARQPDAVVELPAMGERDFKEAA